MIRLVLKGLPLLRSSLVRTPAVNDVGKCLSSMTLDPYLKKGNDASHATVEKKEDINKPVTKKERKRDALHPVDHRELADFAPELRPTFNLAAYANKSITLQRMIDLGVDLSKWEKRRGVSEYILTLDFEEHMKEHITFLHDKGIPADDLGRWLTINPLIFKEDIDDLHTRCNYLRSKKFDISAITRIITSNPRWLLYSTVDIDTRLGYFQKTFKLTNDEVRFLVTKQPKLINSKPEELRKRNFMVLEEMGFTTEEMKSLLLSKPKLWMAHSVSLMRRFDFVHNEVGFKHSEIVEFPKILTARDFRIKQRHAFLKFLGRDQYDRLKPNYVSPDALIEGDDSEFCTNVAKTTVPEFNNFLKTL